MITLSKKIENDMTSWSMAVEEESETLLEHVCISNFVSIVGFGGVEISSMVIIA